MGSYSTRRPRYVRPSSCWPSGARPQRERQPHALHFYATSRYYLITLRATRPLVTNKTPAPKANNDTISVPPLLGSSALGVGAGAVAGAGSGAGGGGGAGAAFG